MPWSRFDREWTEPGEGRILEFKDAVREAIDQAMQLDERVFCLGLDADDRYAVYGTMKDLTHPERVMGTPISENACTGVALGLALSGMRPIHIHMRADFLPVAMDQICNYIAKWRDMFDDQCKVPLVIRAVIGRGWGCGAQHSQTLHGLFARLPGLKVVTPATPHDAKGLLLSAIRDDSPVLVLEHRWLFKNEGPVPEEIYFVPLGEGRRMREGRDLTIVANSLAAVHAMKACESEGIDADLIDPRCVKPLDLPLILGSVEKTGRLLVVDYDSPFGGFAAEILAQVAEAGPGILRAPARRLTFPDRSMPASGPLERRFYPDVQRIAEAAHRLCGDPVAAGGVG